MTTPTTAVSVPRLRWTVALAVVGASLLAGCGDDDPATTATTPTPASAAATAPSAESSPSLPGATTPVQPAATTPPVGGTTGPVVNSSPSSDAATIDVVVGTDSGPNRREIVAVGAEIQLNITNPKADDEYHVHGYDIEKAGKRGEMVTLNFTADQPGTFPVESHETEDVLVVIEVR